MLAHFYGGPEAPPEDEVIKNLEKILLRMIDLISKATDSVCERKTIILRTNTEESIEITQIIPDSNSYKALITQALDSMIEGTL